jgi:hypothetical protein
MQVGRYWEFSNGVKKTQTVNARTKFSPEIQKAAELSEKRD